MKKIVGSRLQPQLLEKTGRRRQELREFAETTAVAQSCRNQSDPVSRISLRKLDELNPPSRRLRRSSQKGRKALRRSVAEFGVVAPLIVRGNDIVDGVARFLVADELGLDKIPTIDVSHLSEQQCRTLAISLNRLAEQSEWDLDALRDALIELQVGGVELELTGFDPVELDNILLDPVASGRSDLNEVPKLGAGQAVSQHGDVWQLDKHRLVCGSATEVETYERLMPGERAGMVLTDPPYNVKIDKNVSGLGKVKHGEFVEASGEMTESEFTDFLSRFLKLAVAKLRSGCCAYVFMDWRHLTELTHAASGAGLRQINLVMWDKGKGGMGSLYRSAHELIYVGCKGGTTPEINNVKLGAKGRDRTNVWAYPGATKRGSTAAKALKDHPTPKPVELIGDAMLDVTKRGDIVLDPFAGSGTIIIAAEECDRVARAIELDPKYVDVAVRRWEEVTAQTAILEATGESFAEVAKRRSAEASGDAEDDSDGNLAGGSAHE